MPPLWHASPPAVPVGTWVRGEGGTGIGENGRQRIKPIDEWEQIELLCGWPEQRDYELIRPMVLFCSPAAERAGETCTASERTLQRRAARFDADGMESLFGSGHARRKKLPPAIRRLVVDLKAEYPRFNLNEIANAVYVRSGRRPDHKTVRRILEEDPIPLRFVRRFPPYHEISGRRDGRAAVVALHADGWSAKAISGYLKVGTSTVYRILRRWAEEGPAGLEDRPHGRPPGVRKVTLKAMEAIRRFQENPHLGEFRIHAALAQIGVHLSPRTCGRILALNRELYGLEKAKGPVKEKKEMPFAARRRHQFWSADIRYVDNDSVGGRAYVVSVMDNHSRCILASAITRTQDLASYLSVLYAAVERYGSPEALVTDGGGVFRARQARAVYGALGIAKHEIERGRPWQNYVETTFNVQRRMADWHFSRAEGWSELTLAHERFVEDYNAQSHFAHRERDDGRRSPAEVLGFASGVRHREEELRRAFFSARFVRILDALGYARFMHWRVYGEEALAGREAALWLAAESLTVEHAGEPISRYDARLASGTGELRSLTRPRLFGSSHVRPQPRLFALDALGEAGWLKALKLEGYSPRAPQRPRALQQALFQYTEAL
jgi:putative transposase